MGKPADAYWSLERLLDENLRQCAALVEQKTEQRERAFRNIRTFGVAHALQRGLPVADAGKEGIHLEILSRDLVDVLALFTGWNDGSRDAPARAFGRG